MGLLNDLIHRFYNKKAEIIIPEFTIIGLGNPGKDYFATRHNIGFRILDDFNLYLSEISHIGFPNAEIVLGKIQSSAVVATVKPTTFMNRSGDAVSAIVKKWDFKLNNLLVIVDDFNLPLGMIRVRRNGSDGGHNGLKSIIEQIGEDFPRLRIGIGPRPETSKVIDFVLGKFSSSEEIILNEVITKSSIIIKDFTVLSIDAVMNKYN